MNKSILLLLIGSLTLPLQSLAQTYSYQAINDFPDINAGEVPFYKDTVANRNVLAINAAREDYRDKFARASRTFDGVSGTYDVTIVALGEIDGECIYRLSVNGEIIGIKENAPTEDDYAEQQHVFKDVVIPAGATISVDASAVSNGLIPENGGFAYARGRWRSLSISSVGEVSDDIDLALTVSATPATVNVGDTINYAMTVSNLSNDRTASGLSVSAGLPSMLSFGASASCSATEDTVSCLLPELAPQASNTVSWTATAVTAGNATVTATTSADQEDLTTANNSATVTTPISAQNIARDAAVTLDLAKDTLSTAEQSALTVMISNNGLEDLADINVELSAEANLSFTKPQDSCIQEQDKLTCAVDSLLAGESVNLVSQVSSAVTGTYTIEARVALSDDEVSENNTKTIMLDVERPKPTTEANTDSGNSGSGGLAFLMLGLLSCFTFLRRKG